MNSIGIEILGLSVRSNNALKRAGVFTIDKLVKLTQDDLYNIRNMGKKSVEEILDVISRINSGELDVLSISSANSNQVINLPLCDDDYLVAHAHNTKTLTPNSISYYQEYMTVDDVSVDDMGFSVRSINALKQNSCFKLSDICKLKYKELVSFKNLGKKSIDEIIEKIGKYTKTTDQETHDDKPSVNNCVEYLLSKFSTDEFSSEIGKIKINLIRVLSSVENIEEFESEPAKFSSILINCILKDDYFISLFKSHIVSFVKEKEEASLEEIQQCFDLAFYDLASEFVNQLELDNYLICEENIYRFNYPSIFQVMKDVLKESEIVVLEKRLSGLTLEEIGKELNVTRERIRQKESKALKKLPKCAEDKYKRLFETYYISQEDFCTYFVKNESVFNYLTLKYKVGKAPIEDLMEDESFPNSIRFAAERAVYKDYIKLDGKYVHQDRASLFEYILFEFAQEPVRFDDLVALYYDLLKDLGLFENEKYKVSRGYENRFSNSRHALWTYPKTIRYYNIDAYDYSELFDAIDLSQYQDVEISTRKIFVEHLELMNSYDIRDEYELHNLLKKICDTDEYSNMTFTKMPHIEFGTANRNQQVMDLLSQLSPIDATELAKAYEEKYGVAYLTVFANYLSCVSDYLVDGVYSLSITMLDNEDILKLNQLFVEDIYTIPKARKLYYSVIDDKDKSFNAATMRQLGYNQYASYLIKDKYNSSKEYFRSFLLERDLFSLENLDKEIYWSQSLWGVINEFKSDYTIIEYDVKKYINKSRIDNLLGVKADEFVDYCVKATDYTDDEFFTIASLQYYGFEHSIDDLGFDEYFYSSLIDEYDRVACLRAGNNRIFKKGSDDFIVRDFIEWYIYSKDDLCIEIGDLIDELKLIYHLSYERGKLLEIIKGSKLYYNSITDKIYADYDVYFDEI